MGKRERERESQIDLAFGFFSRSEKKTHFFFDDTGGGDDDDDDSSLLFALGVRFLVFRFALREHNTPLDTFNPHQE